jgi:hypothetical protein
MHFILRTFAVAIAFVLFAATARRGAGERLFESGYLVVPSR